MRVRHWFIAHRAVLLLGAATGILGALTFPVSRSVTAAPNETDNAATGFPDIAGHWAQPFIEPLAEQDIVAGYEDGTFRPENPVNRDEFAAMLRQAFNKDSVREIASGEVYQDVPADYWAATAIEEAYEMGFMQGYPGGFFRPNQPVSRVEAIVALADNVNLDPTAQPATATRRRQVANPFPFPIAMTYLMEPLVHASAQVATVVQSELTEPEEPTAENGTDPGLPVSFTVSDYYVDADEIPQYAIDRVVNASDAGIVVNYPDPQVFNPNGEATRGSVAAFVHQTMVNQGRLEPLPDDVPATNYVVGRQTNSDTTAQAE
jgi:hypothetical protein